MNPIKYNFVMIKRLTQSCILLLVIQEHTKGEERPKFVQII